MFSFLVSKHVHSRRVLHWLWPSEFVSNVLFEFHFKLYFQLLVQVQNFLSECSFEFKFEDSNSIYSNLKLCLRNPIQSWISIESLAFGIPIPIKIWIRIQSLVSEFELIFEFEATLFPDYRNSNKNWGTTLQIWIQLRIIIQKRSLEFGYQ